MNDTPLCAIVGSAACWWADYSELCNVRYPDYVIAVNDAAWLMADKGRTFDAWATLHPEKLPEWIEKLDVAPTSSAIWTGQDRMQRSDIPGNFIDHWGVGSSALFAVRVAIHKGYEKIVLCGCPMDSRPYAEGAGEWPDGVWPEREATIHREGWTYSVKHRGIMGRVKSMSGWTRELLGGPTPAWLVPYTVEQYLMLRHTVMPPLDDEGRVGRVTEAFWHCPCCGGTEIHRLRLELHEPTRGYHCTQCGRDFVVAISRAPWWAADDLAAVYPPHFLKP